MAGNRLYATGRGETEPRASNSTAEGRKLNRRVELFINAVVSGRENDAYVAKNLDRRKDVGLMEGLVTLAAFERDPAPGVVGGRILLRVPDPAPDWLRPDWYTYWSHFDPPAREAREARHWFEFPWGANWSCRREAIAAAGGIHAEGDIEGFGKIA